MMDSLNERACPEDPMSTVGRYAPKGLHVYPDLAHAPCTDFNAHAMSWLRRYLGA